MSRSQQGQVYGQEQAVQKGYNANANTSFSTAQQDVTGYGDALAAMKANNPYVQGGAVQTAQNQEEADTAAGLAQSGGQALQGASVRSGQNPGAAIAAEKDIAAGAQRTLTGEEAQDTASRAGADVGYQQGILQGQGAQEGMEDTLAQQQGNLAQGAANTEEQAAQTPSFLDELGSGLITGGATVGAAFCPAKGSLYLMADGKELPVEDLEVGNKIMGIDGEPQTIEEIQVAVTPVLRIETDDGFVTRNSRVHAFALPFGGFVVAMHSLGKTIRTAKGTAKIVSVKWDGDEEVFNIITDGSHTYRADGVWALGVGEAERQVSMDRWNEIGDHLEAVNANA